MPNFLKEFKGHSAEAENNNLITKLFAQHVEAELKKVSPPVTIPDDFAIRFANFMLRQAERDHLFLRDALHYSKTKNEFELVEENILAIYFYQLALKQLQTKQPITSLQVDANWDFDIKGKLRVQDVDATETKRSAQAPVLRSLPETKLKNPTTNKDVVENDEFLSTILSSQKQLVERLESVPLSYSFAEEAHQVHSLGQQILDYSTKLTETKFASALLKPVMDSINDTMQKLAKKSSMTVIAVRDRDPSVFDTANNERLLSAASHPTFKVKPGDEKKHSEFVLNTLRSICTPEPEVKMRAKSDNQLEQEKRDALLATTLQNQELINHFNQQDKEKQIAADEAFARGLPHR